MFYRAYYYYFGAIIPIAEISAKMFANEKLRNDIYVYIFNSGLQYRRVGNVRTTWRIIIGFELKYFNYSSYNLDLKKSYTPMLERDIKRFKLPKAKELEITNAIINLGATTLPKYWVIYNHYYDDKNEEEEETKNLN